MKKWKECCEEIGYDTTIRFPTPVYEWFAYVAGESIQIDFTDSHKYKNKESVETPDSKKISEDFSKALSVKISAACEIFDAALREEYSELNDSVYAACYSEAYDRGHSSGYDEVASYMSDVVSFAKMIIEKSKC